MQHIHVAVTSCVLLESSSRGKGCACRARVRVCECVRVHACTRTRGLVVVAVLSYDAPPLHHDSPRSLIDELYNRRVQLMCSAEAPIDELFSGFDSAARLNLLDMDSVQFETEVEGNKSRFDLTREAGVAATNRSVENYSGQDELFAFTRAASRLHEMGGALYARTQIVPSSTVLA